jgi:hypothetical protein
MSDLDGRLTFLAGCHPTLNEHAKALIREAADRIIELEDRLNDFTDPKMPGMVSVGLFNTERETCDRIRSDNDSLRVCIKALEAERSELIEGIREMRNEAYEQGKYAGEEATIERCTQKMIDLAKKYQALDDPIAAEAFQLAELHIRALAKPPEKE